MAPTSPTVAAWELGLRLRQRREYAGLSGNAAARLAGTASAYLCDIEHGKKVLSEERLNVLITAYEFNQDEAAELHALREKASQRGWWTKHSMLFSSDLLRFFGYEHGSERIDAYDSNLINGLLQTADYARAVIESGSPNIRLAEVDRRVECRLRRQQRVWGDDPVTFQLVFNEAALWQQVGGPKVLKAQLVHLLTLLEQHEETLNIRVVPFEATGYDAMSAGSFQLMTFGSYQVPAVVWQESVTSTQLITDSISIREYHLAHTQAMRVALGREDSQRLIQKAAYQL